MTTQVPVDAALHAELRADPVARGEFAAGQHVLSLRATEVPSAISNMPVFTSKLADTGAWIIAGMTSLKTGISLFVENNEWTALVRPVMLNTWPFFLMPREGEQGGYELATDTASPAFASGNGDALFEDGKASPFLDGVRSTLETDIDAAVQTRVFLDRLVELELMRSVDIVLNFEDETTQTITGLNTIDEDRLKSLDAEVINELQQKGYLLLIHAILLSIHQLNTLVRLNNRRGELANVTHVRLEIARDRGAAT